MANDMDGAELFEACLTQATAVVKQVRPEHFANATPDADWSVRDLLAHMLHELSLVPLMIAGKTLDEIGDAYNADLADDDVALSANWQTAADSADLALSDIDPDEPAHLHDGDVTIDDYLMQTGSDLLIHAWDLGKAIGVPVRFDDQLAAIVYDNSQPQKLHLHDTSMFSKVEIIGDADIQTRLLALFGRRSDWHAASTLS